MEPSGQLSYETRGAAGWITLNRPAELNTLTPQIVREMAGILDAARSDAAIATLVITGEGRAFCAGADLKFLQAMAEADRAAATVAFLGRASALMTLISEFPKPVIAAVNGIAAAGGLELVLACDIVLAARHARIGDSHANFGLLPGAGGSARLPRRIGLNRAKHLMFTGELVPAEELVAAGLVNRVVDGPDLVGAVDALAATLATKSPLGLARMKQMANLAMDQPLAAALAHEQAVGALHTASHDRNEGIAAFNEKRTPRFNGS